MKLPVVDAQTAVTGTGLVRADPRALTDVGDAQFRGLQAVGSVLQSVGGLAGREAQRRKKQEEKAVKDRRALDDQARIGEANKRAIDAFDEGLDNYKNFDPQVGNTLPNNPKDYYDGDKLLNFDNPKKIEFRDLTQKDYNEKILNLSKAIEDPKTRQAWINSQSLNGFKAFTDAGNEKHQDYHEALILGNATSAAQNGDIETSNEWIDLAEDKGLIGPKRAAKLRTDNAGLAADAVIDFVAGNAFAVWEQTVTPDDPDGDLIAAFDFIQDSDVPEGDKQETETELKTRVINRRAENKTELDELHEKDRAAINESIFFDKNYDAANKQIKDATLPEKEKTTLLKLSSQRATAAANGVPIKNDRVVESQMYDMSLGIWKGNVSKAQFDTAILAAASKLDDSAYQRVTQSASNTLKSSQAEALTRAGSEAKNVLVNFKEEDAFAQFITDSIRGLEPDAARIFESNAIELRQLQFNDLSNYTTELRDWIADNPDKLGKDFYQFADSLKHDYWGRSIEKLREIKTTENEKLKRQRIEDLRKKAAE